MRIVIGVTGIASGRILNLAGIDVLFVTEMAFNLLVLPGQRIVRLLVVIERPARPSIGLMAKRAIVTKAIFVKTVFVAGYAFSRRVLEGWRLVTCLAEHKVMEALQRKPGVVVIEIDILPPTVFIVAGLTFGA